MRHMYKGSSNNKVIFEDEKAGGYYYAYSKELSTATYTEVFTNVVLPTRLKQTAAISRNAYIAFGIRCKEAFGVDMGLGNFGQGWFPCYYDCKPYAETIDENGKKKELHYSQYFKEFTAPSNATNAGIVIKPISNTKVHMYIQFQDANGKNVGQTFDRDLDVARRSGWNRYYRFASLIPSDSSPSNDSDETYMLGGKFTNTGIYNGKTYVPWGITGSSSLCEVAWVETFPKAQLANITSSGEEFKIDHWA